MKCSPFADDEWRSQGIAHGQYTIGELPGEPLSGKALMWALILLFFIIYITAVLRFECWYFLGQSVCKPEVAPISTPHSLLP